MGKNGYFQLIKEHEQTKLRVVKPEAGGSMFELDELLRYLDRKKINTYDLVELSQYIKAGRYEVPFVLNSGGFSREHEEMTVTIMQKAAQAVVRFYPPSTDGDLLSREEIFRTIKSNGVIYGVKEAVIDDFFKDRCYCTDYIVAEATLPVQGSNAIIEYHFDTNVTSRPKLNEDGSVDFHQLGRIKPVSKGDKLATLTPADTGKPGKNVLGNEMLPGKVKHLHLRFGRNIKLSENKCEIYSEVSGHVTLVDDMVMVSNVYQVPQNVDASTGDIVYSGSVEVKGNILTGFSVKADGDIIVNGVVEGARLESEGNIVLKNGMQGMGRGEVFARGNVISKYLENCNVTAGGDVMSDAMMHTNVTSRGKIEVTGKRGLITGGHIKTYGNIIATNLGSNMGTDTKIEILPDSDFMKEINALKTRCHELEAENKKINQIFVVCAEKMKSGEKLPPDQEKTLRLMIKKRQDNRSEMKEMESRIDALTEALEACRNASIRVSGNVYSGVKIVIKDMMKIMSEDISHCRFVLEGADVKVAAL